MARLAERLRDPVLWSETAQLVKTVAAAVIAWVIAAQVFGLVQPFLAPWAALLTVHATIYRTMARGAQQVGAAVLGVLIAWAAGSTLGINVATLAVVLLVTVIAGTTRVLRAQSTTAAATALMVLLTGYIHSDSMLLARLLDTAVGIGVGLLVNLLVWPPLRDRAAARRVDIIDDRIGDLLSAMARELAAGDGADADAWVERTRELDHDIDDARALVRQARESGRLNLRRRAARRVRATEDFGALLGRLEQAVAELRSMARTIGRSGSRPDGWDWWRDLLTNAGEAVSAADASAIADVRAALDDPPGGLRPSEGALVVNLANILDAMDAVADAQPVREQAGPDPLGRFARERLGRAAEGRMGPVEARDREHAGDR